MLRSKVVFRLVEAELVEFLLGFLGDALQAAVLGGLLCRLVAGVHMLDQGVVALLVQLAALLVQLVPFLGDLFQLLLAGARFLRLVVLVGELARGLVGLVVFFLELVDALFEVLGLLQGVVGALGAPRQGLAAFRAAHDFKLLFLSALGFELLLHDLDPLLLLLFLQELVDLFRLLLVDFVKLLHGLGLFLGGLGLDELVAGVRLLFEELRADQVVDLAAGVLLLARSGNDGPAALLLLFLLLLLQRLLLLLRSELLYKLGKGRGAGLFFVLLDLALLLFLFGLRVEQRLLRGSRG